jgi:hypothetical protein
MFSFYAVQWRIVIPDWRQNQTAKDTANVGIIAMIFQAWKGFSRRVTLGCPSRPLWLGV